MITCIENINTCNENIIECFENLNTSNENNHYMY